MSAIKKIFEFVINNKDANKDIQETKKNITGVTEETQKLNKTNKKAGEGYGELLDKVNEYTFGGIDAIKSFGKVSGQVWRLSLKQLGVFSGFLRKSLPASFKISSFAAKGFAIALAATGITLITSALAILIDYFRNFESAAKFVSKTINVFSSIMYSVIDAFKALFTLDFSGFISTLGSTFTEAGKAADAVNSLYDAEAKLAKLRENSIVDNANLVAEQKRLKKILDDTTLSSKARLSAAIGIEGINKVLLNNQRTEIELQKQALKGELANERNQEKKRELKISIAELDAELISLTSDLVDIEQDSATKRREIAETDKAERDATVKDEKDKAKAIADAREKLRLKTEEARIANLDSEEAVIEANFKMKIEALRKEYGKGTQLEKELIKAKDKELEEYRKGKVEEEEAENEKAAKREQAKLDKINNLTIKSEEQLLKNKAKKEKKLIDSSKSLTDDEKVTLKLEAEQRLSDGLKAIEERKQTALEEIKNRFLPEEEQNLSNAEIFEQKREIARREYKIELEDKEKSLKERNALLAKYDKATAEGSKKLAKEDSEYSKLTTDQKVGYVLGGVSSIINSLAEGSDAAKGFAIAESLFNTYQGITAALASKEPLPIKILNAAATAAAGFAAVNNIMSTNSDGSGARGNVNRGGGTRISQGPRFDTVGDSEGVRNAQNEESRDNTPRETYVVSGKVTNQQDLDRNKQNNSRFV